MEGKARFEILSIDDCVGDQELIAMFFHARSERYHLHRARNGKEGLDFLFHAGAFAQAPTPDLVLLDLNMPGTDGWTVLNRMKSSPELKRIPVVVFSTSEDDEDIASCYEHHANSYFSKPLALKEFEEVLLKIESHWLQGARLPEAPHVRQVG